MKRLTEKQIAKIVAKMMNTEPYKTEFNTPYYKSIARTMLAETIEMAQREIFGDKETA